jgi:hypothetical protein
MEFDEHSAPPISGNALVRAPTLLQDHAYGRALPRGQSRPRNWFGTPSEVGALARSSSSLERRVLDVYIRVIYRAEVWPNPISNYQPSR